MARMRTPIGRATPRLRALRLERMMYQKDLAKAAGISIMAVSRAESGYIVGFKTLKLLATALGVSADQLCGDESEG